MTVDELFKVCHFHPVVTPFVRRHGRVYSPRPLPKAYRRGAVKHCYENSFRMMVRHDLTYVEGYAYNPATRFCTLHAWCVDKSGRVLDRTWRADNAFYFGVPFKASYAKQIIADRKRRLGEELYYGFLDDWEPDFPLIKLHGDKPQLWKAKTLARP